MPGLAGKICLKEGAYMGRVEETSVYVIDDDFRLLSFNDTLKNIYPDIKKGEQCYRVLCHETEPCSHCPFLRGEQQGSIFFNKWLQRWINVKSGTTEWPGHGRCHVIVANDIVEDDKNLLYNMTRISVYDDLLEMNLTEDSYRILYHEQDKYRLPLEKTSLSKMIQEVNQNLIFPEDREAHREFWNLDTLNKRLDKAEHPGILRGIFREMLQNGKWSRVQHLIVSVRANSYGDNIVMCFVSEIDEQREGLPVPIDMVMAEKQEKNALTGLYNEEAFFKYAQRYLDKRPQEQCCLVTIDIEHFKLFNEWYGRTSGDEFLISIADQLKRVQGRWNSLAGYFGADNFAILMPYRKGWIYLLQNLITRKAKEFGDNAGFLPAFGIYIISDRTVSLATMYDRASIALSFAKGNYTSRVCQFNVSMIHRMEEEQHLLAEVERALEHHEFIFYLQPQCHLSSEKIVGAEALIRWNSPERGLISPGAFIPVLEKNGYIIKLDQYIWEEVCRCIRDWIDCGYHPVPISVNVSQVDLCSFDVAAYFRKLMEKYQLDSGLLKIEITESAYAEEFEVVTKTVASLRESGFVVLMDDFGSGYSSLNMLKSVNLDVIKIDMKFLDIKKENMDRGVGILKSVVNMARVLHLPIIVEGVETEEQVDFLKNMGCRYGQGYYYYMPLSKEKFEKLLQEENRFDFRGIQNIQVEQIYMLQKKNASLLRQNQTLSRMLEMQNQLELLVKYIPESIFLYRLLEDKAEVEMLADGIPLGIDFAFEKGSIFGREYEKERKLLEEMGRASGSGQNYHTVFSYETSDQGLKWLSVQISYVGESPKGEEYICICRDITKEKNQELKLTEMAETDELTGLYNRHRAIPEMRKYLENYSGETAALIMIDIDKLKEINDTYGHVYGDLVISTVAKRIKSHFREEDVVSRIGGDEFLVLCKNISAEDIEQKLTEMVEPYVVWEGELGSCKKHSISAGYALYPMDGMDFYNLYNKADQAMFEVKRSGKCNYKKYEYRPNWS